MVGVAYINDKDLWTTWGARLEKGAFEALLTPASPKARVENKSRLTDGTQVIVGSVKVEERDLSLVVTLRAATEEEYLQRYASFVNELQAGWIRLRIPKLHTEYNLLFEVCTKFGNYGLKAGKFSLKLREPNPKNRRSI